MAEKLEPLPKVWTGAEILNLPMPRGMTVRTYLCDVLERMWDGGTFARDWREPLYDALMVAGVPLLPNTCLAVETYDKLIHNAIRVLAGRVVDR